MYFCIRERGSVLYLGMAQEFWDFANFFYIRSNKIVLQCACKGYAHYYLLFTLGRDEVGGTNKSEHVVAVEQTLISPHT